MSPRDFVGVQGVEYSEDGTIEIAQTSVPNDEKTPDVPGRVRGTLTAAGWVLRPSGNDTDVTYLVKGTAIFDLASVCYAHLNPGAPVYIQQIQTAVYLHSLST